jgi:hypothetical protein
MDTTTENKFEPQIHGMHWIGKETAQKIFVLKSHESHASVAN